VLHAVASGKDYWGTGVYREIARPERLVLTDSFSDKDGNVVSAAQYGMTGDWADELLISVHLEADGDKTKMTLRHTGLPPGDNTEMTGAGWNESFDKLEESLQQV
jgi:uncharacterized protein YndB with AHSA1/START domain